MFKSFNREQEFLLPPSLNELIQKDDLVFLITEVVELLDLEPLYNNYSSLGRHAYHPAILLSVLFYAYAQGVFSSRKIAERLCYDVRFMYLAGMQTPDFRTISDFRKDNIDLLKSYFVAIVRLCQEVGMAPLRFVAIDGSKVHASASVKQSKDRKALSKQLAEVEARIAELLAYAQQIDSQEEDDATPSSPADIQLKDMQQLRDRLKAAKTKLDNDSNQTRVNLTDVDCRDHRRKGPCYNCQIAVDDKAMIIVAADVVSDPTDTRQLIPMIEQVEANTESEGQPKQIGTDSGYESGAALKELAGLTHIDAYVASQRQDQHKRLPKPPFDKYSFDYDPVTQRCTCPQGLPMRVKMQCVKNGVRHIRFIGSGCLSCSVKSLCTRSRYRTVRFTDADPMLQKMRAKLESSCGKAAMCKRRQTVEPVFGILKEHLGFRRFKLRGFAKVKGEFALLCSAFNLRKIREYLGGRRLAEALALAQVISVDFISSVRRYSLFFYSGIRRTSRTLDEIIFLVLCQLRMTI